MMIILQPVSIMFPWSIKLASIIQKRKSTRSRSNLTAVSLIIGAVFLLAAPVFANESDADKAAKRAKICAKAEQRYRTLYPDATEDGAVIVKLYKNSFCPANVTVKTGTTVRWINVDKRTSHSVWLKEAGQEESERFFPEEQWEFPFLSPGDYPYLCGPHWKQGMLGFVKVID